MDDLIVMRHHELQGGYSTQINKAIEKVTDFLDQRGNPFSVSSTGPLHNLKTGEKIPQDVADNYISFFDHGKAGYELFRKERFIDKSKKLSDTIHRVNLPKFSIAEPKSQTVTQNIKFQTRKLGKAQVSWHTNKRHTSL